MFCSILHHDAMIYDDDEDDLGSLLSFHTSSNKLHWYMQVINFQNLKHQYHNNHWFERFESKFQINFIDLFRTARIAPYTMVSIMIKWRFIQQNRNIERVLISIYEPFDLRLSQDSLKNPKKPALILRYNMQLDYFTCVKCEEGLLINTFTSFQEAINHIQQDHLSSSNETENVK